MEKSLTAINYRDIIEKYGSRYMSDISGFHLNRWCVGMTVKQSAGVFIAG